MVSKDDVASQRSYSYYNFNDGVGDCLFWSWEPFPRFLSIVLVRPVLSPSVSDLLKKTSSSLVVCVLALYHLLRPICVLFLFGCILFPHQTSIGRRPWQNVLLVCFDGMMLWCIMCIAFRSLWCLAATHHHPVLPADDGVRVFFLCKLTLWFSCTSRFNLILLNSLLGHQLQPQAHYMTVL